MYKTHLCEVFLNEENTIYSSINEKVRDVKNIEAQLVDNNGENKYDNIWKELPFHCRDSLFHAYPFWKHISTLVRCF